MIKIVDKKFDKRKIIYIAKAFAIISIICAHCSHVGDSFQSDNRFISSLITSLGSLGVGVFFVLSGYLMGNNTKTFYMFCKTKFVSIIIPWFFSGSLVYLYVVLRKGGLSFTTWLNFLLGNGSYLWFLTVLIMLYLAFYFFKANTRFLLISIMVSIISNLMTSFGLLPISDLHISPYLFVFNWMVFFAIGLLMYKYELLKEICIFAKKNLLYLCSIFFVSIIGLAMFDTSLNYFVIYFLPLAFIAMLLITGISYLLSFRNSTSLVWIGKESFSIYLLHMPVAGTISNLFNRFDIWWTTPLRPVIVLVITLICIMAYKRLIKIFKMERIGNILIGTRA